MSNPIIKIHNVQTGEVIERDMNAEELAQKQRDQQDFQARAQAELDKAAAKSLLFNKLGITEEEAKLLLG